MNALIYLKRLFWTSGIALFIASCASSSNTSSSAAEDDDMYFTSKDRKKELEAKKQAQAKIEANTGKQDVYNQRQLPQTYNYQQPVQQQTAPPTQTPAPTPQPAQATESSAPGAPTQALPPPSPSSPSSQAAPSPQPAQVTQVPAAQSQQPAQQQTPTAPQSNSDIYVENNSFTKKYHQQTQPTDAQTPPPAQQQQHNRNGYNHNNQQNNQQNNNYQQQQSAQPPPAQPASGHPAPQYDTYQPSSSKADVYVYEFKPKTVTQQGNYNPNSRTYNADDYDNNSFASKYYTSVTPLYPGFNPYGELNITFGYYPWHKGVVYDPYFYPHYTWGVKYGYRTYLSKR